MPDGGVTTRVSKGVRAAAWYWKSVMGDNRYERYLAHHERAHPGEPPLTKAQYWREYTDRQDRNPSTRCC